MGMNLAKPGNTPQLDLYKWFQSVAFSMSHELKKIFKMQAMKFCLSIYLSIYPLLGINTLFSLSKQWPDITRDQKRLKLAPVRCSKSIQLLQKSLKHTITF